MIGLGVQEVLGVLVLLSVVAVPVIVVVVAVRNRASAPPRRPAGPGPDHSRAGPP